MGELVITFGPMFSGKTGDLIRMIRKKFLLKDLKNEKYSALVISFAGDKRDAKQIENLTTHDEIISNDPFPPSVEFISTYTLDEVRDRVNLYDHISIDEAQFFPDLIPFIEEALEMGKFIHCAGLIADSDIKKFGNLLDLFPLASSLYHKRAYCVHCFQEASFTKYIGKEEKDGQKKIGAKGDYVPTCGKCYKI